MEPEWIILGFIFGYFVWPPLLTTLFDRLDERKRKKGRP